MLLLETHRCQCAATKERSVSFDRMLAPRAPQNDLAIASITAWRQDLTRRSFCRKLATMLSVLHEQRFASLFTAQVVALLGTGLLTIALALLAYDLAGPSAGAVLGTALMIKMIAYVGVAPIAQALTASLPRKAVLIGADLIRAAVALCLPWVDAIWHIYLLVFVLQAASATFTPTFQATIPDILTDEADYTRALSLSRLAYELENLISPALAGMLLSVITFHWLFLGTTFGFLCSAILIVGVTFPHVARNRDVPFFKRLTLGSRIYRATPRLRGLMALNLTVAASGAFILVNTVVLLSGNGTSVAWALGAVGVGSIITAIAVPRLLEQVSDRMVMLASAWCAVFLTFSLTALLLTDTVLEGPVLWLLWGLMGATGAGIMTPAGRLLRRSAHPPDRPALFTAQFAASHACWLITYPVAGWVGASAGLATSAACLAILSFSGAVLAPRLWPADTAAPVEHNHDDLPSDHPHLRDGHGNHSHPIIIDNVHPVWPR